jgi:hypothetical protein
VRAEIFGFFHRISSHQRIDDTAGALLRDTEPIGQASLHDREVRTVVRVREGMNDHERFALWLCVEALVFRALGWGKMILNNLSVDGAISRQIRAGARAYLW